MKRSIRPQSLPITRVPVNPFLSLPEELIDDILECNRPYIRPMGVFAVRMVIGLLDRASYTRFEYIARQALHGWMAFFFVERRYRMFSHHSWYQWQSLVSIALLGDSYARIFDDFWDANPLVERQFLSFAMMYVECEVFQQLEVFVDHRIRDVVREFERLPSKECRRFAYHCIMATHGAKGHFGVSRVLPFTHSVALYVYDEASVPQDASTHYLVAIENDETAPKIDLRGLRYYQTEITHARDTRQALNCFSHFMHSFYHHMKGNLYGIDWQHGFPLKPDSFIRNMRKREAFKESLERCYALLFGDRDEQVEIGRKSSISRYMICRELVYGTSPHNRDNMTF